MTMQSDSRGLERDVATDAIAEVTAADVLANATELPKENRGGISLEQFFAVASPMGLLVLWEILSRVGVLDYRIFSYPSAVFVLMWEMARDGTLWLHLSATLERYVLGTLLGLIPGLLLGLTMGLFRWPRAVLNPLISALYPLPRIALFPLILLVVGLNEKSNLLMIALQPFFYMAIGSMAAAMNIDQIYFRVAKSFEVKTLDLYRLVVFPAALPIIVSSLRLSLGGALLVTIAVESLVADNGIGYLIWHSWQVLVLGQAMVGLLVSGILGWVLLQSVDFLERRFVPWSGAAR
jgi:NitT/TauT family transport system permease protein